MVLLRPLHALPVLLLLVMTSSVHPFLILSPGATTGTTTTTTGTTATTGTVGTVGTLGSLGTLTLGTTTLGTGLASLGVLGALKLGVIAIAAKLAAIAGFALAKKLHYKEPPSEYNSYSEYNPYGHHYVPVYTSGYGGGYGGGGMYGGGYGSSSSSHYHKRSIDDGDQGEQQGDEHREEEEEPLILGEEQAFALVHESDESHCGERLVCELARRARRGLQSDEQSVISLIKRPPTDAYYGPGAGSRQLYLAAMDAGYRRRSCKTLYDSCPFNSHQMMALVRSMGRDLVQDTVGFLGSRPDQQTLHPGQQLGLKHAVPAMVRPNALMPGWGPRRSPAPRGSKLPGRGGPFWAPKSSLRYQPNMKTFVPHPAPVMAGQFGSVASFGPWSPNKISLSSKDESVTAAKKLSSGNKEESDSTVADNSDSSALQGFGHIGYRKP